MWSRDISCGYTIKGTPSTDASSRKGRPRTIEWIHSVDFLPASEPQTQENQQGPANNPLLQSLKAVILDGQMKEKVYLCPYVNIRHALTAQDGVILGSQVCYTNKAKTQDYREDSPLSHWYLRLSKNSPKSCLLAEHQSISRVTLNS